MTRRNRGSWAAVGALTLALALACGKSEVPVTSIRLGAVGGGPVPADQVDDVLQVLRKRGDELGVLVVEENPPGAFRVGIGAGTPANEVAAALVQSDVFAMWLVDEAMTATVESMGTAQEVRLAGAAIVENKSGYGEAWLVLAPPAILTDVDVASAEVVVDENTGSPRVALVFHPEGARRFGDATAANVGKRLAIVQSGACISAPVVREAIRGGEASIDIGGAVQADALRDAQVLAAVLGGGALPVPLEFRELSAW